MPQNWFEAHGLTSTSPSTLGGPSLSGQPDWFEARGLAAPLATSETQPVNAEPQENWWDWLEKPLLPVEHQTPTSEVGGIWQAAKETASGFTSPENLALMGGIGAASIAFPVAGGIAGLGFAGLSAYGAFQEAKKAWNAQGPERWYYGTGSLINAAMTAMATSGAGHEFNRAAVSQVRDLIPDASNLGQLRKQLGDIFGATPTKESKEAYLYTRGSLGTLELKRQQLKSFVDTQSKLLDKGVRNQDTANIIEGLDAHLDTIVNELPAAAKDRILDLKVDGNDIDQRLAKLEAANRVMSYADLVTTLDTNKLIAQATHKGEGFRVFDTETGKTIRNVKSLEAAERWAEKDPQYDYETTEGAPKDWVKINFPEFQYYMKDGKVTKTQNIYAPSDVANLFNNHLGQGLSKMKVAGPLYDMYRGLGNTLNQLQLGFSLFHGAFATMDTMVSGVAFGLRKAISGQIAGGLAKIGEGITPYYSIKTYMEGKKFEAAALGKTTHVDPAMEEMIDAFQKADARIKQDPFYYGNNIERYSKMALREWRKGETGKSLGHWLLAAPELFARPLMDKYVPRMKMGLFMDMARFEMDKARDQGLNDVQLRENLAKTWDSIDNRLGQIVYDNLFWKKSMKDLGMVSIRSLGWNIGTFREIGGGLKELATAQWQLGKDLLNIPMKEAVRRNRDITWKMSYVMTLPWIIGLYGGTMHTAMQMMGGKSLEEAMPQTIDDYFFPMTASGNRISLPTYIKDFLEFRQDPKETFMAKTHPLAKMVTDTLMNSDFRNVHITEENLFDDLVARDEYGVTQWFKDELQYLGKQLLPFGAVGFARAREEGATVPEAAFGLIGFPPAPQRVIGSSFEQTARKLISAGSPEGGRTKFQAARSTARLTIEDRIRQGRDASSTLKDAFDAGIMTPDDMSQVIKDIGQPIIQSLGSKLSLLDFTKAFRVATDAEKEQLLPILYQKMQSIGNMPPAQQREALRAIEKLDMPRPTPLAPPPG